MLLVAAGVSALEFGGWGDAVEVLVEDDSNVSYLSDDMSNITKYGGWTIFLPSDAAATVTFHRGRGSTGVSGSYETAGITLSAGEQFTFPGKITDLKFDDPTANVTVAVFPWVK